MSKKRLTPKQQTKRGTTAGTTKAPAQAPRFDYQTFDNRSFGVRGDDLRRAPDSEKKIKALAQLNFG